MFPNLRAELARRNLTYQDLANLTSIPVSTLSRKMQNGEFTIPECRQICKAFLPDQFTLDYLFEVEG